MISSLKMPNSSRIRLRIENIRCKPAKGSSREMSGANLSLRNKGPICNSEMTIARAVAAASTGNSESVISHRIPCAAATMLAESVESQASPPSCRATSCAMNSNKRPPAIESTSSIPKSMAALVRSGLEGDLPLLARLLAAMLRCVLRLVAIGFSHGKSRLAA